MTRMTNLPLPRLFIAAVFVFCLGLLPLPANARQADAPEPFSQAELAQMLAPIALYPDALLSQILMASTYPIEIIEADRWIGSNPGLTGDALDDALLEMDWDPSIKALCHFPSVLALMSERIGETTDLGNAFLAQEAEVMAMVQQLRSGAYAQGHLATNSQQLVFVQDGAIIIEPYDSTVIYVPYYDPYFVYGAWWYPAYPPYYWGPARASLRFGIHYWPATYFSFSFGNWCYFDWPRHFIHIDIQRRPRFVRHDHWFVKSDRWQHIPHHRRGVAYRDRETAGKFGQTELHFDRSRHDRQHYADRNDHDRAVEPRDARPIGVVQDQRPSERLSPGPDRRERQRTEQVRQVRDRSPERIRDSTAVENRRQVPERPGRSRQVQERREDRRQIQNRWQDRRQVVERSAPAQQNRTSPNQGSWLQRRVEATRQIQERPRPEQRQPAAAPPPVVVRQAPPQAFRSQFERVRQEQQKVLRQQQKQETTKDQQQARSNRESEDRKVNFSRGRGNSGSSWADKISEERGRGQGRNGRK